MSPLFKRIMISTVTINAFFLVLWTDYKTRYNMYGVYEVSRQNMSILFCFISFISENIVISLRHFIRENFPQRNSKGFKRIL